MKGRSRSMMPASLGPLPPGQAQEWLAGTGGLQVSGQATGLASSCRGIIVILYQ